MTVAGIVICFNWGTYIWGVNNGHVVDTSLGYYINPLVTVLMGVFFLRERLRPVQWGALGARPAPPSSCSASMSATRRGSR